MIRVRLWRACVLALATACALVVTSGPAAAADDGYADSTGRPSRAVCHFVGDFVLDPGLPWADPVDYSSVDALPNDPGDMALACSGWVNGAPVVPADDPVVPGQVGSYTEWGSTIGNCESGDGDGMYEAWIRTTDGIQHLIGSYRLHYNGVEGTGTEFGETLIASFTFKPTSGACQPDAPLTGFWLDQDQVMFS